jgi:hypothetical protein
MAAQSTLGSVLTVVHVVSYRRESSLNLDGAFGAVQ